MVGEYSTMLLAGIPFLSEQDNMSAQFEGSYSLDLVALSITLAWFGSYVALVIGQQAQDARTRLEKVGWICVGAMAMGGSIWSMHFLGMIAYTLPVEVQYHLGLTALSIIPGVLAGMVAVHITSRSRSSQQYIVSGAVLIGLGIGIMHFLGMAAMRMEASMAYDPIWFAVSVVVAVVLAYVALAVQIQLSKHNTAGLGKLKNAFSAMFMAVAISGMHYIAMEAVHFLPGAPMDMFGFSTEGVTLAFPMVTFVLLITTLSLTAAIARRYTKSASVMKAFFDEATDGVVVADETGIITDFSPSAERMFGYRAKEVLGKSVSILIPHSDREGHSRYIINFRDSGRAKVVGMRRKLAAMKATGEKFAIEIGLTRAMIGGRQTLIATIHDISAQDDLERAENQALEAERANQQKTDFLATMSHEIRTPINGFMGMIHLLEMTEPSDEQVRYLEAAKQSASTLTTLLNDILDFSRLGAGKFELQNVSLNLKELLASVSEVWHGTAKDKGLSLETEFDEDLPEFVMADGSRLRQVLFNFASNATKFTDQGAIVVRCKARALDGSRIRLRFEVEDTGIGLSAEAKGRIFNAFEQADAQTHQTHGGTGLGLAICKHIVDLYDGDIGVENVEPKGSNFWFEASFELAGAPEIDSSQDPAPGNRFGQSSKILVAEDNPANRMFLEILLDKMDLDAEMVENGEEAVQKLRESNFDIILMDIQMPIMDGVTALKNIRKMSDFKKASTPIIAVTANAMASDQKRYAQEGFDGYVSKPIDPTALREEINRLVSEGVVLTTRATA